MEINITDFVRNTEAHHFSASQAELGKDAGKITWANAKREAATTRFIDAGHRDEFERWVKEFGAWDDAQIKTWSLDECNALLIQSISSNLNEMDSLCSSDADEFGIDWEKARKMQDGGMIASDIYRSGDNVYFHIGS